MPRIRAASALAPGGVRQHLADQALFHLGDGEVLRQRIPRRRPSRCGAPLKRSDSGPISPPGERMTARSMTLRSSRTLPGQRYASSASSASRREAGDLLAELRAEELDVVLRDRRDVLFPLAQRRQQDRDDAQAVVEVEPELALPGRASPGRGSSRRRCARPPPRPRCRRRA